MIVAGCKHMHVAVIMNIVLLVVFLGFVYQGSSFSPPNDLKSQFLGYVHRYNKSYVNDTLELARRLEIFKENLKHYQYMNELSQKHNETALYGINKFSDLTSQEFEAQYLSKLSKVPDVGNVTRPFHLLGAAVSGVALPDRMDWRDKKIIGPVKNQRSCGGCWAFSTVEAVEAMHALSTGHRDTLSAQQIIDCSYGFRGRLYGCKGGDTCTALAWMNQSMTGVVRAAEYPDTDAASQQCKLLPRSTHGVHVTAYTCQQLVGEESELQRLLARVGPVVVAVDAALWQSYLGGIIRFHCGQRANNHAVLIVGYDTTGPVPYYIVKNSWGTDFGDDGYLYIAMGHNVCGLARRVSVVYV